MAYARTMGYPIPPKPAVNRGIAVEALATIIGGNHVIVWSQIAQAMHGHG